MPKTKRAMPEMFHKTADAFRRGTRPVKGRLFGLFNRLLISSSTGSGVRIWITKRIVPTTINQAQRGTRLLYELII